MSSTVIVLAGEVFTDGVADACDHLIGQVVLIGQLGFDDADDVFHELFTGREHLEVGVSHRSLRRSLSRCLSQRASARRLPASQEETDCPGLGPERLSLVVLNSVAGVKAGFLRLGIRSFAVLNPADELLASDHVGGDASDHFELGFLELLEVVVGVVAGLIEGLGLRHGLNRTVRLDDLKQLITIHCVDVSCGDGVKEWSVGRVNDVSKAA